MNGLYWLVLPTYNERDNIDAIIRGAAEVLQREVPGCFRILVVDDGSPDGTGDIADALAAELDTVSVLHRTAKEGLGRAYLAGFAFAMANGADWVIEMDSDFSHDPADLAGLLAASRHSDVVLGSRYVQGGRIEDWGALRRLISFGGSAYARWVLGVRVRDLTGGFKCLRREVLEAIAPEDVLAQGYAFQVELTYRAIIAGFTVTEVPITFRDRLRGQSKMSADIALEAAWLIPQISFRAHRSARRAGGRLRRPVSLPESRS
jgi:dolichol-phosphate mannosyltransferase